MRDSGATRWATSCVFVGGRQAGADVEELPYPTPAGEVPDSAPEEQPVGEGVVADAGVQLADLVSGCLVDLIVVLAAQPVVPDPGRVWLVGLDSLARLERRGGNFSHRMSFRSGQSAVK
jgi:hypothetical protein